MKLVHIIPEKNRVFNIFRTNDLPCVTKNRQTTWHFGPTLICANLYENTESMILFHKWAGFIKMPKVLDKTIDNVI